MAIKINLNNFWNCVNRSVMDAYPEKVNSVVDGLIQIGVPAEKIWITDILRNPCALKWECGAEDLSLNFERKIAAANITG